MQLIKKFNYFLGDVEKAFSSASASSLADGFGDFSKPGHRCSGKSGFPDRHDAFDMNEGSAHREHGHEEGTAFFIDIHRAAIFLSRIHLFV